MFCGIITDERTDHALARLKTMPQGQPIFLYLSHKAAHAEFVPADRHARRYRGKTVAVPVSRLKHDHAPMWIQRQRNSWHCADQPVLRDLDLADHHRLFCETLLGVDESVGRVLAALRKRGQLDDTVVPYMGDIGFGFGEHGMIDKRTAYEWSKRVPLLVQCPSAIKVGRVVKQLVAYIDVAPTLHDAAGPKAEAAMPQIDGRSFWPLLRGETVAWRDSLPYEYYWEPNFPQTPTRFEFRSDRYKFVRAYGLCDIDELYDLERDPQDAENLIVADTCQPQDSQMRRGFFATLKACDELSVQIRPDNGKDFNERRPDGSPPADFPPQLIRRAPKGTLVLGKIELPSPSVTHGDS